MTHFRALSRDRSKASPVDADDDKDRKEIGSLAVWQLSSAKPGSGIEQLRDGNPDTYWQSDGTGSHHVNIQFLRKVTIDEVRIYLNYRIDESYTPQRIAIRAGTTYYDLQEIRVCEFEEPVGWVSCVLSNDRAPVRANFLQLAVLANHQNGRDTHIRQIRIYGPRQASESALGLPRFYSPELSVYATLR